MSYLETFKPGAFLNSDAPRAFPGKYPTRIYIRSTDTKRPFEYGGKPSEAMWRRLENEFFYKGGSTGRIVCQEYDRNGQVFNYSQGNIWSTPFYSLYYPLPINMLNAMGRIERFWMFRLRTLTEIKGKKLYLSGVMPQTSMKVGYRAAVVDALKGITTNRRFGLATVEQIEELQIFVERLIRKFDRRPTREAVPWPEPQDVIGERDIRWAVDELRNLQRVPVPPANRVPTGRVGFRPGNLEEVPQPPLPNNTMAALAAAQTTGQQLADLANWITPDIGVGRQADFLTVNALGRTGAQWN